MELNKFEELAYYVDRYKKAGGKRNIYKYDLANTEGEENAYI